MAFEKLRDQLQSVLKEPSSLISLAARVENTIHDKIAVENDSSAIAFRTPSSTADRCEMLEHENSNLRQLIASISSILCDLSRNVIPIEDENVSIEEMTELPITWVYDRIKAQIETCLNVLSDHILP